jgi:ribosome-associated translation inhibitor RaiA
MKNEPELRYGDEFHHLRVEIDPTDYPLTPAEREKMDNNLDTLRKAVKDFPISELKVEIIPQAVGGLSVTTSLRLTSRTLFTADQDRLLHPAWERCVRKLVNKVRAFKDRLGNKAAYAKESQGTRHVVHPAMEPSAAELSRAVEELDYLKFRNVLGVYDEAIEKRAGRWIERYPEAENTLGDRLTLTDIVEEVFLNAFEAWEQRPPLPLGQWLESLIDLSIKALLKRTDDEKENLSYLESAREAELARNRH